MKNTYKHLKRENYNQPHEVSKPDFEGWLKTPLWVVYAMSTIHQKQLKVAAGSQAFQVIHGKEIVYDGPNMVNAIEVYNSINSDPKDEPKLDN